MTLNLRKTIDKQKKIKHSLLLCIFILLSIFIPNIYAQVTIGSGSPPAPTALLQIKDQESDEDNITSNQGGLLLPRTALVNTHSLEPFSDPEESDYQNYKRESVGMLVYNVTADENISPGVYFWDGNKWVAMISSNITEPEVPESPDPPITNINDPEMLTLPNSYILPQGNTLIFPVMKCYAAWKQVLDKEEYGLEGSIEPVLLWQSKQDLIKSVSLHNGDKGIDSYIKIETRDLDGNALIALKIEGKIMWSWHLWITNYNPDEEGAHRTNNGYTMMDRNIGALYSQSGNILSGGMIYQWGRKDPFPGTASLTIDNTERRLYDINNNLVEMRKEAAPTGDNRPHSTLNPMTFLTNTNDWSGVGSAGNQYWNTDTGGKGLTDPCPRGWRVPKDNLVWKDLPNSSKYRNEMGLDWDKNGINGGIYPVTGRRVPDTGTLEISTHHGYIWTGHSPANEGATAIGLFFGQWEFNTGRRIPKATGACVRCVREE